MTKYMFGCCVNLIFKIDKVPVEMQFECFSLLSTVLKMNLPVHRLAFTQKACRRSLMLGMQLLQHF